jgi:hypothetical protein
VKDITDRPNSVRDTVVILRCRDIVLTASDRTELHKSEVALGHVFKTIHRIEWTIIGTSQGAEAQCRIHARSGEFAADGAGLNARSAMQDTTGKILKQKRRAKETAVSRRRVTKPHASRA